MSMTAKRRRKGKPYNPGTVHDRRAQDLLRNAQVVADVVECPYDRMARIEVTRSTRHDPLFDMKSKRQIDQCDYMAGRHWQAAYENAEIGHVKAIDPSKEAVSGGRMPEVLTKRQMVAVQDLKAARDALGTEGAVLVMDILGKGWSVKEAALARGRTTERDRRYVGDRFRECLATLAKRFGYSNEPVAKVIEREVRR